MIFDRFYFIFVPIFGQEILLESELNKLMQTMLTNYDVTERARVDEQLVVTVNFYIQGLSSIDEANMDYEISIYFRQVYIQCCVRYITYPKIFCLSISCPYPRDKLGAYPKNVF